MRTQAILIEDGLTWGDTGPLVGKLNIADPISAIDVIIEANNGATSNQGQELHDDVDRVELIDGSDRLHSLSLVQGIIQHAFEHGQYPHHLLTEEEDASQQEGYRIYFGRHLGDEEYWLDPSQFRNLQYRLTGDLTISATAGFATGTRSVTLIAHILADRPAGRSGFFSAKEIKSWTTAASGEERSALPDDFPIRYLGFRAFETGIAFHTDVTRLKLTQGKDRFVHFDITAQQFRDILEAWRGQHEITTTLLRTDGDSPALFLPYIRGISTQVRNDLDIVGVDAITVDQATIQLLTLTATPTIAKSSTDQDIFVNVRGLLPHFGGLWPLGDPNDPRTWLMGDDLRNLELVATQGGAGGAASIWVQQVRP